MVEVSGCCLVAHDAPGGVGDVHVEEAPALPFELGDLFALRDDVATSPACEATDVAGPGTSRFLHDTARHGVRRTNCGSILSDPCQLPARDEPDVSGHFPEEIR